MIAGLIEQNTRVEHPDHAIRKAGQPKSVGKHLFTKYWIHKTLC